MNTNNLTDEDLKYLVPSMLKLSNQSTKQEDADRQLFKHKQLKAEWLKRFGSEWVPAPKRVKNGEVNEEEA